MSLQASNTALTPKTQSGSLIQTGDVVTGSVLFTDTPCTGVASVNGSLSGSTVSLDANPVGTSVNLSGTVSVANSQTSMTGNYTILSTGCYDSDAAPQTGKFVANLVSPLNGNITGNISSSVVGTSYSVTGTIAQGANAGTSDTPLTGSLTFTSFCYPSANIVGSISGNTLAINLLDSTGASIGQISGTSSLDGTLVTGTYTTLAQATGTGNCVNGDNGTVTLAVGGK